MLGLGVLWIRPILTLYQETNLLFSLSIQQKWMATNPIYRYIKIQNVETVDWEKWRDKVKIRDRGLLVRPDQHILG